MFRGSTKALALVGVAVAVASAAPAAAQGNPFVPSKSASRAELERMKAEILKEVEDRMAKSGPPVGAAPGAPMPGAPVPPGGPMPGAPVGAPVGMPGAPNGGAVPGGMMPPGGIPGAPGAPAGPIEEPKGAVEAAQDNGVRFLGCINGEPKFVSKTGLRVKFTQKEVRDAVKAGFVPECR